MILFKLSPTIFGLAHTESHSTNQDCFHQPRFPQPAKDQGISLANTSVATEKTAAIFLGDKKNRRNQRLHHFLVGGFDDGRDSWRAGFLFEKAVVAKKKLSEDSWDTGPIGRDTFWGGNFQILFEDSWNSQSTLVLFQPSVGTRKLKKSL